MRAQSKLRSHVGIFVMLAGCGASHTTSHPSPPPGSLPKLTSVEVLPANAAVNVENGAAASVAYHALGHFDDGHSETLSNAQLSLDSGAASLGALDGNNQFTASGQAAGVGHVTAQSGGVSGTTIISVTVHVGELGPNVPTDAPMKFGDAPAAGPLSPKLAYPLDGAIMPTSVGSPDVQWEGPISDGDLYRVQMIAASGVKIDGFVAAASGSTLDWQPSNADWSLVVSNSGGQPIQVRVDYWNATAGAQGGKPIAIKLVASKLAGTVYYWDLSDGKIQRLDGTTRTAAIPNPPANPADSTNNRCVACHAISHDGRYLASELWGGGLTGAVFDLSKSAVQTGDPAPTLAPLSSYNALFSTFNPDASRLLVNAGTGLTLIDPQNGMSMMSTGTPLPTSKAAHPTWSPDGSMIAFINNIDGAWAVDYTKGDLQIIPVTGPDNFGAPVPLVNNSTGDPNFAAPSWPTFAPDSKWIAYGAGVNSRGRNTIPNTTTEMVYPGALFIVPASGGTPTQLTQACGGALDCYLPNFSPYDDGGYIWLVFYSLRDYGNSLAGSKGTQNRQMWVTAIDKSKLGSGDPSAVPYWLPGQDPKKENMSAFWALSPPIE